MLSKCNLVHGVLTQDVSLPARINLGRSETFTKNVTQHYQVVKFQDELRAGAEFIAPVSPSRYLADAAA